MNDAKGKHSASGGARRSFLVCLVGLALSLLPALVVQAKIIYVDKSAPGANNGSSWYDAYIDLQFALQTASSVGDEICVAAGAYTPTSGSDRTATFQLKNGVALYGGYPSRGGPRDWKNNDTILSGDIGTQDWHLDNSYHVVTGSGTNATAVLDGFTVTRGRADYGSDYKGGGMSNIAGSPTVANCTFRYNLADDGTGMYNLNSSPAVTNCIFTGNATDYDGCGSGMYNDNSSPTVTNCAFSDGYAGYGGGMYNAGGTPVVTNCTFFDYHVQFDGGGMYNASGSPTVTNCTFYDNEANRHGGAMYISYFGNPMVTNCTFSSNYAASGAGMYNNNSSLTVTNCTFSGNVATGDGGGMYNAIGSFEEPPEVENTILAGNNDDDCAGVWPTSVGYNLEGGTSCGCKHPTDRQNTDPLLGPLQDNGGPTKTHALLPGSPAIDAIPPPYNNAPPTDQRGIARPQPTRGYCDIGAVEMQLAYAKGDVNGDGSIDLLDVRLCTQIAQGIISGSPAQHAAADVDRDGDVDMDDVSILSEYVLGTRTTLP